MSHNLLGKRFSKLAPPGRRQTWRPRLEVLEERLVLSSEGFLSYHWDTWDTNTQIKVLTGDFNGDGKTDVMKFDVPASGTAENGLWVGLSDGARFSTSRWSVWQTNRQMKALAGDFNGDGKTDIMKYDVPASGTAHLGLWVGISDGTKFNTTLWATGDANSTMQVLAGDFNGDGLTDVMKFDVDPTRTASKGLWVGISDGTRFNTSLWSTWQTSRFMKTLAGDFNGGGKTDVMKFDVPESGTAHAGLWVGISDGTKFNTSLWATGDANTQMQVLAGDFNGDGVDDVMRFDVPPTGSSPKGLWVSISNGAQFTSSLWSTWTMSKSVKILPGDFNGDGKTDVMKFDAPASGTSHLGLWVGISDGTKFNTSQWATGDSNVQMKVLSGDFNGDGKSDVMKVDVPASGTTRLGLWVSLARAASPAVPVLNSLPGAWASLHLDFNGHAQQMWGRYSNIATPVFDLDGDPALFSPVELNAINEIWQRVVEDFAPFKINVTTVNPTSLANGFATGRYLRVAIGGSSNDWYRELAGGVSYKNSFIDLAPNTVYVFPADLSKTPQLIADAVSHEAGHAFGLDHQSRHASDGTVLEEYHTGIPEYYGASSYVAPLMGKSYAAQRSTWWLSTSASDTTLGGWWGGTSASTTVIQDDMAVIARAANGFGYRPDDHSDHPLQATSLWKGNTQSGSGIVSTHDDMDWFGFTTSGGTVTLRLNVAQVGPNLNSRLSLWRLSWSSAFLPQLSLITDESPYMTLGATITRTLPAGTYLVRVSGAWLHGDVGQYTLNGVISTGMTTTISTTQPPLSSVSTPIWGSTDVVAVSSSITPLNSRSTTTIIAADPIPIAAADRPVRSNQRPENRSSSGRSLGSASATAHRLRPRNGALRALDTAFTNFNPFSL